MLHGDAALFLDGGDRALFVSERDYEKRGVGEPETESIIRGPGRGSSRTCAPTPPSSAGGSRTPQLEAGADARRPAHSHRHRHLLHPQPGA